MLPMLYTSHSLWPFAPDHRLAFSGARRKGAMIVRIKEDQAHTALIKHLCTMIVGGIGGDVGTGNMIEVQRRREADQDGVCFDQRQKIWVPCRHCLLGLKE